MIVKRRPVQLEAWKVPKWGTVAEEDLPAWLVSKMQSGEIFVNRTGGISAQYVWGSRGCNPGDYILFDGIGEVDFCRAEDFEGHYERVTE